MSTSLRLLRVRGPVAALLASVALALTASSAHAQPAKRATAAPTTGPQAVASNVDATLAKQLSAKPVPFVAYATLDTDGLDLDSVTGRADAAARLKLSAIVAATVAKRGRLWTTTVTVYQGRDGAQVGQHIFQGRNPRAMIASLGKTLWAKLGDPITAAEPPASKPAALVAPLDAPTPTPETPTATRPPTLGAEPTPPASTSAVAAPFVVGVGLEVLNRDLSYQDNIFDELRPYSLPAAPALAVDLAWLPTASLTPDASLHAGVYGELTLTTGLEAETAAGEAFPTYAYQLAGGAQGVLASGAGQIGLRAGFRRLVFAFDTGNTTTDAPLVPDVAYDSLEVGAQGRADFGATYLRGVVSYLLVLGTGPLQSDAFFPQATAQGLHAEVGFGYGLSDALALDLGVALDRYGLTFDPSPGDPLVAGGGIDQLIGGTLSLVYQAR